jgi:putative hemolysin
MIHSTLWPWKVKKIAEEEGSDSPFRFIVQPILLCIQFLTCSPAKSQPRLLEKDITKFLTAILIGTTTCTIYSAAMFTDMVAQYFGDKMVT